jgi:anti-sigma regulatory factor (Ser/Thr protein kinase)
MTSAASPPSAAPPSTAPHEQAFPAHADQAGAARAFLAAILAGWPAADDAVLCLSELVTNAITHSRSRQPGGHFTVRAHLHGQRLRVEVRDQGGPWHSPARASADEQNGRGLLIVGQLASRWACGGHSQHGWTVWYEINARPTGQEMTHHDRHTEPHPHS